MKKIMIHPNLRKVLAAGAVCAALGAGVPSAKAQTTYSWQNVGTSFSDSNNWSPAGGPPTALDSVVFNIRTQSMTLSADAEVVNFSSNPSGGAATFTRNGSGSTNLTLKVTGSLTKDGSQTLVFRQASSDTYKLSLDINHVNLNAGTLAWGSSTNSNSYVSGVKLGSATINGGLFQSIVGQTSGTTEITGNLHFAGSGTVFIRQRTTSSLAQSGVLSVGSLSSSVGTGVIEVNQLTSGSAVAGLLRLNNAAGSSAYNGILRDGGTVSVLSVEKNNAGTQVLAGVNTYTGATTINAGSLLVGSANVGSLGNTAVTVNAGTLGGTGSIAGTVAVGNGTGTADALLSAGDGAGSIGTLTLTNALSLNADSNFVFEYNGTAATADQVAANGVTINAAAVFSFSDINPGTLFSGTTFVVINNTSGNAISGTFLNLVNGSTFISGANEFAVNYSGGVGGNDLVLTVVPEPATTALLGAGLISVLFFRRRAN